jgi:hypothetical protein
MLLLLAIPSVPLPAIETNGITEYRSIDGTGNHLVLRDLGKSNTPLIRIAPAAYGNGTDLPRGVPVDQGNNGHLDAAEQTGLPSPRRVSNLVHDQGDAFIPSGRRLNQLVFQFGQFLSHDTSLAEPNAATTTGGATGRAGNERFNVPVGSGDPVLKFPEIPATRSVSVAASVSPTGKREQINTLTTFIDGSQVYGSDAVRAAALRAFEGGLLETVDGPDGELMPYNTGALPNGNAFRIPESRMFLAGDVRANEQVGLIMMHTLWVREHNRVAREIAERDFEWEDLSEPAIDEEIYQRARAVVVALLQKVTYHEWLPALIGYGVLPEYAGYDPTVDPRIANEFTSAAFRIGHTMLPPFYQYTHTDGSECELSLLDAFFNPGFITSNGIDSFLGGLAAHRQQEIDRFVVGEVRNFLFGPSAGGLDLPALNLQRGRDHGLPDLNTVRQAYGLSHVGDLLELTGDPEAAEALHDAYGADCANTLDLWTGGLCETPLIGTNLGETFTSIFVNQFVRLRDGDRFYFENEEVYPEEFIREIRETTFADIIRRNSSLEGDVINDYAFFEPGFHPFQPDCRIGFDGNPDAHLGDGVYNDSAGGQTLSLRSSRRGTAHVHVSLENDGAFYNHLVFSAGVTGRQLIVSCFEESGGSHENVTAAMRTGLHEPVLAPGESRDCEVYVRCGKWRRGQRVVRGQVRFDAHHYWDGWGRDTAAMAVTFR